MTRLKLKKKTKALKPKQELFARQNEETKTLFLGFHDPDLVCLNPKTLIPKPLKPSFLVSRTLMG
jgi:hypothetical protein